MTDRAPSRDERIAELRRQWLGHAAAAFDLMFHSDHQPDLVTFDQRERRAVESVEDLKGWLLGQHLAADPDAGPPDDRTVNCPHCGKPAKRIERPDKPLFRRTITSLAGEVTVTRAQWRCATCRVAFFPSGPQTPAGR